MSTIADRIKAARQRAGLTQADLAEKCGWPGGQRRTSHYEAGRSFPSYEDMAKMGRVMGVNAAWLAFGDSSERMPAALKKADPQGDLDSVWLPELGNEDDGKALRMDKEVIEAAKASPGTSYWLRMDDNSMDPVIPEGSTIAVDTNDTEVSSGRPYVVENGGLIQVKLLYKLPKGAYRLRSINNDEWPEYTVEGDELDEFRVVGRVFWYSVLVN